MKLTAKLAYSQLKINRGRTIWTLIGIILSVAMLTAVYGFALGGRDLLTSLTVGTFEAVGEVVIDDYGMRGEADFIERSIASSARFTRIFVTIASVLSAVIISISVVVISNSFRVSAAERLRQFGILKSVGATKKQIRQTVLYESVFLAMLGIPIGVVLGLCVQFAGAQIANHFLYTIIRGTTEYLRFAVSWQILLAAVLVSFFTVLLSAWLPAQKAAKVPAIDAVRGAGEVKVNAKKIRTRRMVTAIFGFSGVLAHKTYKRNSRNIRATVISLTVGIILFIGVASFGATAHRTANVVFRNYTNASVAAEFRNPGRRNLADYVFVDNQTANEITARLRNFDDTHVMGVGQRRWYYKADVPVSMMSQALINHADGWFFLIEDNNEYQTLNISLLTTDPDTHAELARRAGVPIGSNILINHFTHQFQMIQEDGTLGPLQFVDFVPYIFSPVTLTLTTRGDEEVAMMLPLHGQLGRDELPSEVWGDAIGEMLVVIVPELDASVYVWYAHPDDAWAFSDYLETVLYEYFPLAVRHSRDDNPTGLFVYHVNLIEEDWIMTNTVTMIMIFIYGFVALLILIGLTNIVSTISTNIKARSREFAVLKSVGMDEKGLYSMLSFESIFCSAKALILGVPFGVLISYLIHNSITDVVAFAYEPPFRAVLQSVIGVFIITWGVTRFSARKLRRENIVEKIRADSGM